MINSHQRRLDQAQLDRILAGSGLAPTDVRSWAELGDATYNTAYRIHIANGDDLVLKVAPDPAAPTMSYELDLMRTEAMFYRSAIAALPVPEVLRADFSRQVIDSDFLLMTALPGQNWVAQRDHLTDNRAELRHELGTLVAGLHRITNDGNGFGYPQHPPSTTWRTAFTAMLNMVLTDAQRFAAPLPWSLGRIQEVTSRHVDTLDEVRTPVLVHFDLWDGNILVDNGRITGIVDGERAFWGDPLAEMVSLALLSDIEQDLDFLSGYRSAGGQLTFDASARTRLALYQCYLYLIVLTEGIPRGYSATYNRETLEFVSEYLIAALRTLAAPT
ncbi:MAG TPA: aminoglycoside phosphotransferase family protein [Pseudonocardiaceae bacterium]|nr:aminoglycoside phosphotransferase family protein [Pseudonocardiaceae bacterium]